MASNSLASESAVFISASKYDELASCVEAQLSNGNVLLLIRGIPGTGKSSLGKRIASAYQGVQYESDNNFMVDGEYQFDASLLAESHEITQSAVRQAMAEGQPLVVVTNTFTRPFESEPYIAAAEQAHYVVVIFDLFQHILSQVGQGRKDDYLRFLADNNIHGVPSAKVKEMSDRYHFGTSDLIVLERNSESLSAKRRKIGHTWTRLLDTKYYLALEIRPAERNSRQHSPLFLACLYACAELIEWVDFSSLSPMIKQMMNRNLRSHAKQTGCSPSSLAGWTQFHVTLLNPSEYDALESAQLLAAFKHEVDALRLDAIHDPFVPLLAGTTRESQTAASAASDASAATAYQEARQCVSHHIGVVQGPLQVSKDEGGSKPCSSERFRELFPDADRSTAFYLALPASPLLRSLAQLRRQYLAQAGYVGEEGGEERGETGDDDPWCPHITLAFSPHDVHPADRRRGLATYRALRHTPACTPTSSSSSSSSSSLELPEDSSYLSVELLLHTEVQVSASTAYGFQVLDFKVRKGPFGDDLVYRSHPILLDLLPRGLVFVQPLREGREGDPRRVRRGLSSLRKFFGKEGMEDDGPGWTASEWTQRFHGQLQPTRWLVSMEKVNGRAASARFFRWEGQLYVLVGTKLAHTVACVDRLHRRIRLDAGFDDCVETQPQDGEEKEKENEKEGTAAELFFHNQDFRKALIASNTKALELSLHWDRLDELEAWLDGRTVNGEVVDPDEMHLVPLSALQWVHLCCTDFPPLSRSPGQHSPASPCSFLEERRQAGEFYRFLPPITLLALETAETNKRDVVVEHMRQVVYSPQASEGQVLYFLDAQGRVIDLVKYKTWWYVYRRSIRQLAHRLLTQYYTSILHSAQNNNGMGGSTIARECGGRGARGGGAGGSKYDKRLQEQLERLQKIAGSMSQAKKQDDAAFQAKLQSVQEQIQKIELQLRGEEKGPGIREGMVETLKLEGLVQELEREVSRKWLGKFSFMKEDLGEEAYAGQVSHVISLAIGFLRFLVQRLAQKEKEKETVKRFKCYYPLLWEDFREQYAPADESHT